MFFLQLQCLEKQNEAVQSMFLCVLYLVQARWLSGLRAKFQRGTPKHFDLEMKLPFIKAKTLIRFTHRLLYLLKSNSLRALFEKCSTAHILMRASTDLIC